MNECLMNKKVLFIGIGFYDYEDAIRKKIQDFGATVYYFTDKSIWERYRLLKIIAKIFFFNDSNFPNSHFNSILKKIEGEHFDYVFVIKGDRLTEGFVSKLKSKLSSAEFILYQWDSLVRIPSVLKLFPYFNKIFSFDRVDCLNDERLVFRPLFYRDECVGYDSFETFDISFIGLLHSERYSYIDAISQWANQNHLNVFLYLTTGWKIYLTNFFNHKLKFLHINRLSYKKVASIIAASKSVLDISHPLQSGLTMRTIEAIGLRKKIITTNSDIVNYDFYNESNVTIFNGDCKNINLNFINLNNFKVDDAVMSRYTLSSWVKDVFNV
jgi:hypothetical protein